LTDDVPDALASHAIVAWFQPQIDAEPGGHGLRGAGALGRIRYMAC
jgi:hypothetical protein